MQLNKSFFKFYWKIQKIIAPDLKYSQTIFEEVLKDTVTVGSSWLDLGCGHQILPPWRFNEEEKLSRIPALLVGLDYDLYSLQKHHTIKNRVAGDILNIPFKDSSFEIVSANMVFEHLREPSAQLQEIFRILKPGGTLLIHTPNTFSYATIFARLAPVFLKKRIIRFLHGRKEDDIFPAYYRINSRSKIKYLAEKSGFSINEIKMIPSSAQFVMIPPLVIMELICIRLTMLQIFKSLRTNIIVKLRKPDNSQYTFANSSAIHLRS